MSAPAGRAALGGGLILLLLASCGSGLGDAEQAAATCKVLQAPTPLPAEMKETSGLALAGGLLWTHNDSGSDPVLYALTLDGQAVGQVPVPGARNLDWEDVAAGPCPSGTCLYIADIGDNEGSRRSVAIYRIPVPDSGAVVPDAERFPFRYPGGGRDAESLLILPAGDPIVVTKGRRHAVAIYRYPLPLVAGASARVERVRRLSSGPLPRDQQVTGAAIGPDGEWVALRTYTALLLYRTAELLGGGEASPVTVDLTHLAEPQGEGVAVGENGRIYLTSEGADGAPPSFSALDCSAALTPAE